jgi:hypothetical protein
LLVGIVVQAFCEREWRPRAGGRYPINPDPDLAVEVASARRRKIPDEFA